jgi:hypothetical protein
MQKTLFFIAFVLISLSGIAQSDTLYQGGKYYNTNIFVYNPDMDGEYSIQKIIVNEDTIHEDLATNGIEIDLSSLNLKEEDPVELKIIYKSGNEPSIVNPEALSNQQKFRFSRPKIYKGKLQWRVNGSASDYPIVIEEYRWNEWRVVGEVDPLDTVKNNLYQYEIGMHSGTNIIRIHTTNIQGQKVVSKVLRFVPPRVPKIVLESTKVKEDITFSSETEYELYEIGGKLIKKGVERYVDVRDLPKGEYWLNYDNTTVKIKKK